MRNLNLPSLSSEAKQVLDKKITFEELNEVISQLPNNKAADPDGCSTEFYKKFRIYLVPMIHCLLKKTL